MTIALDMMGGDFAPQEAVKGIVLFLEENNSPVNLLLIGDEQRVSPLLNASGISSSLVSMIHAPQVIGMHEHPTRALREKQQSSISIGFQLLATGQCDAFVSAGNTGAMLVGALYSIKAFEGVLRPAISSIIPQDKGGISILVDVGLNADCKPEHLNQFAVLGSLYAKFISGIDNPRVALINIGEEEGKGNLLAQAAYLLLKENPLINFVGNIEGRNIIRDKADVMVCDGFTGNIILKMAESFYDVTAEKNLTNDYFERFNLENYGGTPVLGVSKPVIIGHGISRAKAFANMIRLSVRMSATDLFSTIRSSFQKI
jgi:glycerol-3-phosphate acyltransferase PlsX